MAMLELTEQSSLFCTIPPEQEETVVLPTLPDYPVTYDLTSKYYYPLLSEWNTTGYIGGPLKTSPSGPFGFGDVVEYASDQCIIKSDFAHFDDRCITNPGNCPRGLSFSIWGRITIPEQAFYVEKDHSRRYLVSSGGDHDETRAFPGVAIYYEGIDLVAVVSTGTEVWHLDVRGQLLNESWVNIGILWEPFNATATDQPLSKRGGLGLYINALRVGHAPYPLTPPEEGWNNVDLIAKAEANGQGSPTFETEFDTGEPQIQKWPVLMFGCHRNALDLGFRDFAVVGTQLDEFAWWGRKLQVNRTHNEVQYFTGGYVPGMDNLDSGDWNSMIHRVRLDDSGQAQVAALITSKFLGKDPEEGSGGSEGSGSGDEPGEEEDTGPAGRYPRTRQEQLDYERQIELYDTVIQLITLKGLEMSNFAQRNPRLLRKTFTVLSAVAAAIADSPANEAGWNSVQLDPSEQGSSELVHKIDKYVLSWMQVANTSYFEDFPGLFSAERDEMIFHSVQGGMLVSAIKFNQTTFRQYGSRLTLDDFYAAHPVSSTDAWYGIQEEVKIPTRIYFVNQSVCEDLPVTMLTGAYPGYGKFAPLRRNPSTIRARKIRMDGIGVSVKIEVGKDPQDGERDLSVCEVDQKLMKYDPVHIKFRHIDPQTSRRKLLWNDEINTDIERRKCVVWNENIGNYGGWDGDKCTTVLTEQTSTICECATFGTYSVIAELVEEPWLPPEDMWLKVVKYIGFVLSLLLLTLFCGIIATSSWLHDMFHLIRLNAGVCILIADIAMIISQSPEMCLGTDIRDGNIALSALQQYFFGVAGFLIMFEGFATFQAIVAGIIGGKTLAFLAVSYGGPLINVGLTMYLYGEDYGKDPRCFIGWENETKKVFFYQMMSVCGAAALFALVIVINMTSPKTRRESAIDQLASQGQGLSITIFSFTLIWIFGYPTFLRFPDLELPDFFPIFMLLNSWFGVIVFAFLGVASGKFRTAVKYKFSSKNLRKMAAFDHFGTEKKQYADESDDNEDDEKDSADKPNESDDDGGEDGVSKDEQDVETGLDSTVSSPRSTVTQLPDNPDDTKSKHE